MSDFAGPGADTGDDGGGLWAGGSLPPMLLGALGAALLIALALAAFLIGKIAGENDGSPLRAGSIGVDDPGQSGAPVTDARVLLTLSIEGGGSGKVTLEPRGIKCTETCARQFVVGTRVSLSADPVPGSRFEGWEDACTGSGQCSFTMDRERSVTATFEGTPTFARQCDDDRDNDGDSFTDDADPGCRNDDTEAPDNRPPPPTDCNDGIDNDSDGLIDTAQDPGCEADDSETDPGSTAPPPVTTPPATSTPVTPPPPATTTTAPAVPPGTPPVSECRDGRDNDGDGRVDRPGDPGCDSDATEAGG